MQRTDRSVTHRWAVLAIAMGVAAATASAGVLTVTDDLVLRLDGSSVAVSGGNVTAWNDLATAVGGGNDFSQGNAARARARRPCV